SGINAVFFAARMVPQWLERFLRPIRQLGGFAYLDVSRASSGSISRTMAQTAAIRASRAAASALLRSASSWSMASARRRNADPSIEHTIEDYQVGGVLGPAC